jgi:hypothetical protein
MAKDNLHLIIVTMYTIFSLNMNTLKATNASFNTYRLSIQNCANNAENNRLILHVADDNQNVAKVNIFHNNFIINYI